MFKNYCKIAWRNITRHKAYSALNIAGLSIGMACSILILLWVQNELSYDRFHPNSSQLYRITCNAGDFKAAVTPAGIGPGLLREMPEIKSVVRLSKPVDQLVEVGNTKFEEKNVFFVDSNFLQVFSFPLIKGNSATALQSSDNVLITAATAKKYFGNENALGKVMRLNNKDNFTVAGVLANPPSNSHLQFDILFPMSTLARSDHDLQNNSWSNFVFYTYILLNKNIVSASAGINKLEQRIDKIYKDRGQQIKVAFQLQPLTDIHLHSRLQIDLPGNGNIQYVNILFIVAIFIILVACINFMNLATARSTRRAKEVG
ncbi:MAG: ABC transporter permease, partial [Ferruginibacter sp.]